MRINFLEGHIAQALVEKGFDAKLITSDGRKERITEYMIKRLTEDPLAVAVMDGFNRNVMYEIAIRHALCLPTIHLIDASITETPPFDLHDVELIKYPTLTFRQGKFSWSQKNVADFRGKLQQRAEEQLTAPQSGMFSKGLRKASAPGVLEAVFAQKRRELDILVRELRLNIVHIVNDYRPDDLIEGPRAKAHADLLNSKFTQLHTANDTLLELIEGANLAAVQSDRCSAICRRISDVTEQLATVIKTLKNAGGTRNARIKRPPRLTRKTIAADLEKIIAQSLDLARQISPLHSPANP